MTTNEALSKAMNLCSTREYAPSEIETKLLTWGISNEAALEIIENLKRDKFIDEYRMAVGFANDKLRFNKWGKVKIKYMLRQKGVSEGAISQALAGITDEEYMQVLRAEIGKKRKSIKDADEYKVRAKIFQFASGRGFEAEVIYKLIGDM